MTDRPEQVDAEDRALPRKPGSFRAALAASDFRLLAAGHAVSAIGQSLSAVALIVLVFESTRSPAWVAAASIARLLPYVLFSAAAGVVADRYGRRTVMIASDIARAGFMAALVAVSLLDGPPALAIGIAFLATAAGTPYFPAAAAMTPSLVAPRHLAAANSIMTTVESTAFMLGPAIGGVLLVFGAPALPFAVNAMAFVVSMACVARIRSSGLPSESDAMIPLRQRFAAGLAAVVGSAGVATLLAMVAVVNLIYGFAVVLLVFVADGPLAIGSEGYGFLNTALGAGAILAALVMNRLAADSRLTGVLSIAVLAAGLPFAVLAFVGMPPAAYGLMLLAGGGSIVVEVLSLTLLQRTLPQAVLARVFGIFDALAVGAILIGSLLAPPLVASLGLEGSLVVVGAGLPLATMLVIPSLRALQQAARVDLERLVPRMELLGRSGVLDGAPAATIEALARAASLTSAPAGSLVIRQDEPADDLYFVVSGALEVLFRDRPQAEPVSIGQLTVGDYFGEIGLLEGIPRTASVRALSDTSLYRVPGEFFLSIVNQAPSISGTLLDGVVGRLARTHPSYRPRTGTAPPSGAEAGS